MPIIKELGIRPIPVDVHVLNPFINVSEDLSSLLPNHPYTKKNTSYKIQGVLLRFATEGSILSVGCHFNLKN
jgi:hypothetical protein